MTLQCQHVPREQVRPQASALPLMVTRTMASTQTLAAVGPRTRTWPSLIVRVQMTLGPQVAAQATQICMTLVAASLSKTNTALGVSQTAGHCMALGSNRSHRHHQSRAPITARPRTQTWYPAAVQVQTSPRSQHSIGLLVSSDSAGLLDQLPLLGHISRALAWS